MDPAALEPMLRRYGPLVLYVLFLLVVLGLRILVFMRRTGTNPVAFGRTPGRDPIGAYLERTIAATFLLFTVAVSFRATEPGTPISLGPIRALEVSPLAWVGAALALVSVVWTFLAQGAMGASWRIGIPEGERTALVTGGLFRFCRNPIYLGVFVGLAGQFLLTPATSLALLAVLSFVAVEIQVRFEERFLVEAHGAEYLAYARRVGRYVPWLGRFRAA